jgi:hypothetical protein
MSTTTEYLTTETVSQIADDIIVEAHGDIEQLIAMRRHPDDFVDVAFACWHKCPYEGDEEYESGRRCGCADFCDILREAAGDALTEIDPDWGCHEIDWSDPADELLAEDFHREHGPGASPKYIYTVCAKSFAV